MISNYQEALVLYSTSETERRELEFALLRAQIELQQTLQKFKYARKGLTKAEFRTGKIRRMIKKSGFSNILQKAPKTQHQPVDSVVNLHRMLYIFFCYFECFSQYPFRKSCCKSWSSLCYQPWLIVINYENSRTVVKFHVILLLYTYVIQCHASS